MNNLLGSSPLAAGSSAIQTTNAADHLNAKLGQQRDVALRQECRQVETGRECRKVRDNCGVLSTPTLLREPREPRELICTHEECRAITVQQCSLVSGKLQLAGALIIDSEPDVSIREPDWKGIPTDILGRKLTYTNCNTEKQSNTVTVVQEVTQGSRVQMTKAISSTNTVSAKVGFEFKIKAEVGATFSQSINTSTTSEQNFQTRETLTHSDPVVVPAMSLLTYTVMWRRMEVPVFFSGHAGLDGPVTANLENIKLASQLLPNPDDRRLPFEGVVYNTTIMNADIVNHARALTSEECKGVDPWSVVSEPVSGS